MSQGSFSHLRIDREGEPSLKSLFTSQQVERLLTLFSALLL